MLGRRGVGFKLLRKFPECQRPGSPGDAGSVGARREGAVDGEQRPIYGGERIGHPPARRMPMRDPIPLALAADPGAAERLAEQRRKDAEIEQARQ